MIKFNIKTLVVAVIALSMAFAAEARQYKFFTTIPGACPIQLYVNGNLYWITTPSDKKVLNLPDGGNEYSAIDAYGQNMHTQVFGSSDGGTVTIQIGKNSWSNYGRKRLYEYRNGQIIRLDHSSSSQSSSSSRSSSSSHNYDANSSLAASTGAAMSSAVGGVMAAGVRGAFYGGSAESYPNFQIQCGASHMYAEFARLKIMIGGGAGMGMVLYGGVGKEYVFDIENERMLNGGHRFPWHAGLGAFLITGGSDNSHDLTFGVTYTETPAVTNGAVMVDATWSKYFGGSKRIGLFIGGGIGIGDLDDDDGEFMWDVNVGIAIKLWQHD